MKEVWLRMFSESSNFTKQCLSEYKKLVGEGHYEQALTVLERAQRLDPNDPLISLYQCMPLLMLNRTEEVLTVCEQMLRLFPCAPAYTYQAEALNALERYQEALDAVEQALQLDPGYLPNLLKRGTILNHLERYQHALVALEAYLQQHATAATAYKEKGIALFYLQRYEEALAAFEQALKFGPLDADITFAQGHSLLYLKRYEEALAAFEQTLRLDPPEQLFARSRLFLRMDSELTFRESVAAFEQTLRERPSASSELSLHLPPGTLIKYEHGADLYRGKGKALFQMERYEEALAAYEAALRLNPDDSEAYLYRGAILSAFKRYPEALASFEQGLRLDPNNEILRKGREDVLTFLQ